MSVHPLFEQALAPLKPKEKTVQEIPCRVTADLVRHEADLRRTEQPEFNEYDDDLMHDVVGKRLAKPVQELLLTLREIETTLGSFGDPDKARLYEQIVPELKALRLAVYEEWKDQ